MCQNICRVSFMLYKYSSIVFTQLYSFCPVWKHVNVYVAMVECDLYV